MCDSVSRRSAFVHACMCVFDQSSHFTGEPLPVLHCMVSGRYLCVHVRRCGSSLVPRPCTQLPFHGGCVQGVCTRVARVGGRCVCVAHYTQGGPLFMHKVPVSHYPALVLLLRNTPSLFLPPPQVFILVMIRTVYTANV